MFYTVRLMGNEAQTSRRSGDGQDYAVLRQSGTSAGRARVQLGLGEGMGRRLERRFQAKAARGEGDVQLPKFAWHEAHVASVMAQGGFCAFSERRIGRAGAAACLPLLWPGAAP